MWSFFLVAFIQILFVRIIWHVRPQLPPGAQVAVEMIIWGGAALIMSLTLIRRMWWVLAFPLCVGSLGAVLEPTPRRLLLCGYPIVVGLLLWQWLAAARSQNKSADASPSSNR